jgi:FkbM family methyltransferase
MSKIKDRLKQSKIFRAAFWPLLRLRANRLERRTLSRNALYSATVQEGKIVLKPANIPGSFAMDAISHNAQRIVCSGNYELEVTEILARFAAAPQGMIVNVGANVGFFSVYLARLFPEARILAIEPNPSSFEYLVENVARNGLQDRIRCEAVCIGAQDGEVEFSIIPGKSEYSSIGGIVHPSVSGLAQSVIKVPIRKIESLVGDEGNSLARSADTLFRMHGQTAQKVWDDCPKYRS